MYRQQVVPDSRPRTSPPEVYKRSKAVVSRLIGGEMLVLPVRGDVGDLASFYTLNGTAATIWVALEQPRSLTEICDVIRHQYEIGKEKAEEDIALFMLEMCSLGLATIAVETERANESENHESAGYNARPA